LGIGEMVVGCWCGVGVEEEEEEKKIFTQIVIIIIIQPKITKIPSCARHMRGFN